MCNQSVLNYFRSTLGVGLKFILSIPHLQSHFWLWGCCSFACRKLLLRKSNFWVADEPGQSCSPWLEAGQSLSDFSSCFSSKNLPWFSLSQLLSRSQSLSECSKSLSKAFNLQTAGEWGWSSSGIVHFNCSRWGSWTRKKLKCTSLYWQ